MRIIDIKNNFLYCLIACFLLAGILGCAQTSAIKKARDYSQLSQAYYQQAAGLYKDLIAQGRDLKRLHFELGQLYYQNGKWKEAIGEFNKTAYLTAHKFLAISHYRLGNFTDALEAFSKGEVTDDEYLYYHALTCEKLNLFGQALSMYEKIKAKDFMPLALERMNIIEKESEPRHIEDIDPEVARILENAPPESVYPEAGALILFCDEKIEVTLQNTQVTSLHYLIKILNERGKEDFSESHVPYDSTYEKVELEYARTIKPDGTVVDVGIRHLRDVSKYLNFPLYSNAHIYIISFPEVAEGSTIEYKIKIRRSDLINRKDVISSYPLQTQEPILTANFSITLPQDKTLYLKILNDGYNDFSCDLKPRIEQEQGRLTYSWQFKGIPQVIPESNMPPGIEINPTILISTFSSWQEVYQWWWQLAKDKINADSAIKEKVRELMRSQNSDEAKIRAIYNFCAKEIRYVGIEYGQAGYEPHYAADIFKNKYGDCKDQAVLLAAMLKEAGFVAWPVLVPTKECYNLSQDFPAVFFNHCICAVSLEGRLVFLDPTAETCSFGDLPEDDIGRQVLIFKDEGYAIEKIPLYPAGHSLLKQYLRMKVDNDESIAAEKSIFSYGAYDQGQRFWMLYTPPELIRQALEEKIQDVSIGAKLDNYHIRNLYDLNTPVILDYSFRGTEYFTVAGKTRIMPQLASLDTALVAQDERKYPIDFSTLDTKETLYEIEIPQNLRVKYMPASLSEESPWFNFIVEYSQKENKIYFRQKIELKKNRVSCEEYPDFKAFLEDLARRVKQRVILEKG